MPHLFYERRKAVGKKKDSITINKKAVVATLLIFVLAALIGVGIYFISQKGIEINFDWKKLKRSTQQQTALIRTTRATADDFKVSAQGEIPEGYSIQLKNAQDDEKAIEKAENLLAEGSNIIGSYDISIDNNKGKEYQPGKKGKSVSLLIENDDFRNYDEIEVCHIPDFGKAEMMNVVRVRDDAICLTTEGFSTYVFGGKTVTTKDSQTAAYLATGKEVNEKLKKLVNKSAKYTTNDTKVTKILWTDEDISGDANAIEIEEQDYFVGDGGAKYSHTANINDDGVQNGDYGNNLATKDVVTIPGADKLHITLKYKTENSWDMVYVFKGKYEGSVSRNIAASTGYIGKYTGNENTVEFDIEGDTATFAFYSDSSNAYYGYYAIIEDYQCVPNGGGEPIYARLNDTQIELYTKADRVYFNADSSYLFSGFQAAEEISIPYDIHKSSKIDTSLMTNASYMFNGDKVLESLGKDSKGIEIGTAYWNMSGVTTVAHMFEACTYLLFDCSYWNTKNLEDASYFASGCQSLAMCDISGWDLSKLLNVSYMFSSCNNLMRVVLSSEDNDDNKGALITNYSHFLDGCEMLEAVDMSDWDTASGTDFDAMLNCKSVTEFISPKNASASISLPNNKWYIDDDDDDKADSEEYYNFFMADAISHVYKYVPYDYAVLMTGKEFNDTLSLLSIGKIYVNSENRMIEKIEWTNTDISSDSKAARIDAEGAPVYAKYDSSTKAIHLYADVNKVYLNSDSSKLLQYLSNLTSAAFLEDERIDTSKVTTFYNAFSNCNSLRTLDVSKWDMSKVTTIQSMFYNVRYLKTLDVSHWETSNIENISGAFQDCNYLETLDTSEWDTSNMTDMSSAFNMCSHLKSLDVSKWDTSKVRNMSSMFGYCYDLTAIDVSKWNTSNVTAFSRMFYTCGVTTLDVSGWDISKAYTMTSMFYGCSKLTALNVSKWDTSNIKYMSNTFQHCSMLKVLDVSAWNTSKVEDFACMFLGCSSLSELNVSNWNIEKGKAFDRMFEGCSNLETLDVTRWKTDSATSMTCMFKKCYKLTNVDVSLWNVSKTTRMYEMFMNCQQLKELDLSKWDVSQVTSFSNLFCNCSSLTSLGDISKWNVSQVTSFYNLFYNCPSLTSLDLSGWDTSNITTMSSIFEKCTSLELLDVSGWTLKYDTDTTKMMWECNKLKMIKAPETISEDKYVTLPLGCGYWHLDENKNMLIDGIESESTCTRFIDAVKDDSYIYLRDDNVTSTSQGNVDYTVLLPGEYFRSYINALGQNYRGISWTDKDISTDAKTRRIDCEGLPVYAKFENNRIYLYTKANRIYLNEDCSYMFNGGTYYVIPEEFTFFEDERIDATRVTTFEKAFGSLCGYSGNELVITNLNASSLKNMDRAFEYNAVKKLVLTGWNTPKLTSLRRTFSESSILNEVDVTGWNTSNVTTLEGTFQSSQNLKEIKGISEWDVSKVTSLEGTFLGTKLAELDVTDWDTSNVTNMSGTFRSTKLTYLDLSKWNTSNVTTFSFAFAQNDELVTLDVSGWDTRNATNMSSVFSMCRSLTFIDMSSWQIAKEQVKHSCMIEGCTNLVKVKAPYFVSGGSVDRGTALYFPTKGWGFDDNEDGIIEKTISPSLNRFEFYAETHTYIRGKLNTVDFVILEDNRTIPQQAFLGTNTSAKVTLPNYKKPGFLLDGWYADKECTVKYDETQVVKDSFTLYARWKRPRFNITFDPNGGTLIGESSKTVIYGMQYDKMPSAKKEGMFFGGWRTPSGEVVNSKNIVLITSDTTLTAYWSDKEITFTVTFETNGGSEVSPQQVGYGKTVERPETTKAKYIIDKWYTDEELTTEWDFSHDTVDCDMTLYAGWIRNAYDVTFDANGGSFDDNTKTKTIEITVGERVTAPKAPERTKYSFVGWSLDGKTLYDMTIVPESDITLYAVWEKNTIRVTFNTSGGSFSDGTKSKSVEIAVGDTITAPETPTKEKYTFLGWSEDGRKLYDMSVAPEDDLTLYAAWEKAVYTVTFDANGGYFNDGAEMYSVEVKGNEAVGTVESPVREGYSLAGWYCNGDMWKADMAVTRDITVTAVWRLIEDSDSDKLIIDYKRHEWENKDEKQDIPQT